MSDLPQVHTGEPLVPISDDDVAYRAKLPHWPLTEALFLLSGYKPPGYQSTRHMQDHFWSAYNQAVLSIELGDLCRKIERAGEPYFIERPVRWLAWADSIGPEHIKVDERMRRALSQKADRRSTPKGLASETPETRREKQGQKGLPSPVGRKKGQAPFARSDKLLVKKMHKLIGNDEEKASVSSAAQQFAGQAEGAGTLESKADRLRKRYREEYPLKEL